MDSSKSAILDATPFRKQHLVNNVEGLVHSIKQNGSTTLKDETDEFDNDDNHQVECNKENTEVVMIDKEKESMKKAFHINIYETLPGKYPDLVSVRANM